MGINLHWESESGETHQMVNDDGFFVSELVEASKKEKTVCLRFIDPYGDTVFNQAQIPYLKSEFSELSDFSLSDGAKLHRKKLLGLIEQASGKTHTYLKFYGD